MLINLSNHASSNWSEKQLNAANDQFGIVVDVHFPRIEPTATKKEVEDLAKEYLQKCLEINTDATIHIMGEMTFVYAFVNLIPEQGSDIRFIVKRCKSHDMALKLYKNCKLKAVASTSERKVSKWVDEDGTTKKNVVFNFVQFRPY